MPPENENKVQANLVVKLLANDVVVAESDDSVLWQEVLGVLTGSQPKALGKSEKEETGGSDPDSSHQTNDQNIIDFAKEIGVSSDVVIGACSPSEESPFIHLENHYWEAFKKNVPSRGPNSVAPLIVSATLLALWFKILKQKNFSQDQAQQVLSTINLSDRNPSRSINNCEWLQNRSGKIHLNPAETSKAVKLAKAYCSKQKIEEDKK